MLYRVETHCSIPPDHKAVFFSSEIDQAFTHGPGTWKFNYTLLKDPECINLIQNDYPSIQDKYKETDGKQLSYELLKMEMKSMTITY